ncbi:MAG TPA: hypothetical protein VKB68_12295 [Stellaceae bacterium]|nr:hypothetical protein [Stellaceae bacterium]
MFFRRKHERACSTTNCVAEKRDQLRAKQQAWATAAGFELQAREELRKVAEEWLRDHRAPATAANMEAAMNHPEIRVEAVGRAKVTVGLAEGLTLKRIGELKRIRELTLEGGCGARVEGPEPQRDAKETEVSSGDCRSSAGAAPSAIR